MNSPTLLPAILTLALLSGTGGCARREIKVKQTPIPVFKMPLDLDRTHRQWEAMHRGEEVDLAEYNDTVGHAISQIAFRMTKRTSAPLALKTTRGEVPLEIDRSGIENPSAIDRVIPIDSIKVKRGLRSNTRVNGIGAPLVVRQKWTPKDPMVATTGLWYPVTAILDLNDPSRPVMRFLDPTKPENATVRLGRQSFPLQADYTASIARDLYDRQTQFVNLSGLIQYERFSKHMGLYRISAFDPEKIPVVFVHGLKSTPNTWNDTLNEMLADPVVRTRYEFWTFGYPTGAPVPFLSSKLRDELRAMAAFRRRNGAPNDRVTLVTHSMGGLISKPLTQASGTYLWDQVFTVPPDRLSVSEDERQLLQKMFLFEPLPYIDRVVFIAVPHKGSSLANHRIGSIAEVLIEAPNNLVHLGATLVNSANHELTPLGEEVVAKVPTSVQQLSLDSPAIRLFSSLPLNPAVTYHSIIGNEKGPERQPNHLSSDGVVRYESSHIDGVESELVIKAKHGVHEYPAAIEEIVRILKEN